MKACRPVASARRRQNADLCVSRTSFFEPLGAKREAFYEQRLLFGLAWHTAKNPEITSNDDSSTQTWTFSLDRDLPSKSTHLKSFTMRDREIVDGRTFEQLCENNEDGIAAWRCACCAGEEGSKCGQCVHALGWHFCEEHTEDDGGEAVWCVDSLHNGNFDVATTLWSMARRQVPLHVMKERLEEYIEQMLLDEDEYTLEPY